MNHAQLQARFGSGFDYGRAAPGSFESGNIGIIGRSDQASRRGHVGNNLLLIPDVIPRRDYINAVVEKILGHFGKYPVSMSAILAINDDKIDLMFGHEPGKGESNCRAPWTGEHVPEIKHPHNS